MEIIIFILSLIVTTITVIHLAKKAKFNQTSFLIGSSICFWVMLLIILFVKSTGDFKWWKIETSVWAQFGSIFGAILLVMTIIYQIHSFRKQKEQSEKHFQINLLQTRFYEQVKYHRENVSEMMHKLPSSKFGNTVNGRKVFVEIEKQFTGLFFDVRKLAGKTGLTTGLDFNKQIQYAETNQRLSDYYETINQVKKDSLSKYIRKQMFVNLSYQIIFFGFTSISKGTLTKQCDKWNSGFIKELFKDLSVRPAKYEKIAYGYWANDKTKGKLKSMFFTKYYGGHQSRLGHYFRHLFQTIRLIDESEIITYEEKCKYVKTLRAQMTTQEQSLLFFDSLSTLGQNWEHQNGHFFVTKYNLIKNIPEQIYDFIDPQEFYPHVVFEGRENNAAVRIAFLQKIMPDEDLSFLNHKYKI